MLTYYSNYITILFNSSLQAFTATNREYWYSIIIILLVLVVIILLSYELYYFKSVIQFLKTLQIINLIVGIMVNIVLLVNYGWFYQNLFISYDQFGCTMIYGSETVEQTVEIPIGVVDVVLDEPLIDTVDSNNNLVYIVSLIVTSLIAIISFIGWCDSDARLHKLGHVIRTSEDYINGEKPTRRSEDVLFNSNSLINDFLVDFNIFDIDFYIIIVVIRFTILWVLPNIKAILTTR